MSLKNSLIIYGADTDLTDDYPLTSAVAAIAGVISFSTGFSYIKLSRQNDNKSYEGNDGKLYNDLSQNKYRTYDITLAPKQHPASLTDIKDLFDYEPVFDKRYLWLFPLTANYNLDLTKEVNAPLTVTSIPIVLEPIEEEAAGGLYLIGIKATNRNPLQ